MGTASPLQRVERIPDRLDGWGPSCPGAEATARLTLAAANAAEFPCGSDGFVAEVGRDGVQLHDLALKCATRARATGAVVMQPGAINVVRSRTKRVDFKSTCSAICR